ncbi:MAG: hypothetical protein ABIQ16_20110, partial [Polyangiaceae bacterium]
PRVWGSDSRRSRPPSVGGASFTPVPSIPSRGLPLGVKLVGFALGLLGLVYGLTVFRDHLASVEASIAKSALKASGAPSAPPNLRASLNAASLRPEPAASASFR